MTTPDDPTTLAVTDGADAERRKGVAICRRCREVYTVWIRPDGKVYPISANNNCSCGDRNVSVIDGV